MSARYWWRITLATLAVLAWAATSSAVAAPPPFGGLTQLPGDAGCVTDSGNTGLCADGDHLQTDGYPVPAISPDGRNVYLPADDSDAFGVFARDPATGAIAQLPAPAGCVAGNPAPVPGCSHGSGVTNPLGAAVSGDGRSLYVASHGGDGIGIFRRDPATGALSQAGDSSRCITKDTVDHGGAGACHSAFGLVGARSVAVSPDGANVYVASYEGNAVAAFSRNASTSALTPLPGLAGCTSDDGFDQGVPGRCTDGKALQGARVVTVSPDGANVYVASEVSNAVAVFSRNSTTGALTQLPDKSGCVSEGGSAGACTDARAMSGPRAVTVSPDGNNVYVASGGSDAVAIFARTGSGALSQLDTTAGCVSDTGSEGCANGTALVHANDVGIARDGRSAYVAMIDPTNALAVFNRDPATGALTQLQSPAGCLSDTGTGGACTLARVPAGGGGLALSADGLNVYSVTSAGSGLASFQRELPPVCSPITQPFTAGAPGVLALPCSDPNGDPLSRTITAGPAHGAIGAVDQSTGTVAYTPAGGFGGADSLSFEASDGTLVSPPATATLAVTPANGRDTVAPILSHVSIRPRAFAAVRRTHKSAAKTGATFRYTLSEAASVTITIQRVTGGHRVHGRCRAGSGKRRCKRYRSLGRLRGPGAVGPDRKRFNGRVRSHPLRRGPYRAVFTATDAQGNRSKPHRLAFRITR